MAVAQAPVQATATAVVDAPATAAPAATAAAAAITAPAAAPQPVPATAPARPAPTPAPAVAQAPENAVQDTAWRITPAVQAYPAATGGSADDAWLVICESPNPGAPLEGDTGKLLNNMLRALRLHHSPHVWIACMQRPGHEALPALSLPQTPVDWHAARTRCAAQPGGTGPPTRPGTPGARCAHRGQLRPCLSAACAACQARRLGRSVPRPCAAPAAGALTPCTCRAKPAGFEQARHNRGLVIFLRYHRGNLPQSVASILSQGRARHEEGLEAHPSSPR